MADEQVQITRPVRVSLVEPSACRTAPPCSGVPLVTMFVARKLKRAPGRMRKGPEKMSSTGLPTSLAAVPEADQRANQCNARPTQVAFPLQPQRPHAGDD